MIFLNLAEMLLRGGPRGERRRSNLSVIPVFAEGKIPESQQSLDSGIFASQKTGMTKRGASFGLLAMTASAIIAVCISIPAYAKDEAGSAKPPRQGGAQPTREGVVKEPEELYNEGVGLYREREYPKAADSFSNALVTKEPDLEAKANYNIANSKYKEGKALGPGKEGTNVRLYKEALDYYKRSMELDQADEDAKFNYEFVQKELKALEAKQQKKEQQQKQEQKQEQKQDKQQGGQDNQQQQQKDQKNNQQEQQQKDEQQGRQQQKQQQEQESRQAQEDKQKQEEKAQDQKSREAEEQKAKEEEKKAQSGQAGAADQSEQEKQNDAQEPQEEERGGMSRQEAQILLDAYGQQEEGTLKLQKRHTERDVEKDW